METVPPQDGREVRRWLARPDGPNPAALWFLTDNHVVTTIKAAKDPAGVSRGSEGWPDEYCERERGRVELFLGVPDPEMDLEVR